MWDQVVSTWRDAVARARGPKRSSRSRSRWSSRWLRTSCTSCSTGRDTSGRACIACSSSVGRPSPCSSWASKRRSRCLLVCWEPSPSSAFVPPSKTRPRSAFYSSLSPRPSGHRRQLHAYRSALRGSLRRPGRQVAASRPGRGGRPGKPHALRREQRLRESRRHAQSLSRLSPQGARPSVDVHSRRQGQPSVSVQAAASLDWTALANELNQATAPATVEIFVG